MTDSTCSGWELDGDAHRVLSQLSVRTKSRSGLITADAGVLARALSMDQSVWMEHFRELTHLSFVDKIDGSSYLMIRCTCERADGLPKVGAKDRKPLRGGPVLEDTWEAPVNPRPDPPRSSTRRRSPEAMRRHPPVGRVSRSQTTPTSSKQSVDGELVAGAKPLHSTRIKARSVPSEPVPVTVVSFAELRMAFKKKWNNAGIPNKLHLSATHVLDDVKTGAFMKTLRQLRDEEGLSSDQILAMMDTFMAMVLSREIDIRGKQVWRVFVARRMAVLERTKRTQRFGSGEGILHDRGQGHETLDWLRAQRLDRRSPSE